MGAADALLCGLADHFVPAAALPALTAELAAAPVHEVLPRYAATPEPGDLAGRRPWIDHCYAAAGVEEIVERLLADGAPAAKEAAETILAKSPTALKTTLAALRRAADLRTLEQVLTQEFRVSCAMHSSPDLVEGIRAQVVDKDRDPRWSPARLDAVTDADVERFFAPLGAGRELVFPDVSSG